MDTGTQTIFEVKKGETSKIYFKISESEGKYLESFSVRFLKLWDWKIVSTPFLKKLEFSSDSQLQEATEFDKSFHSPVSLIVLTSPHNSTQPFTHIGTMSGGGTSASFLPLSVLVPVHNFLLKIFSPDFPAQWTTASLSSRCCASTLLMVCHPPALLYW